MSWRGDSMSDGDAFFHGESLGIAHAIRAFEQVLADDFASDGVERRRDEFIRELAPEGVRGDDVREALTWLEEQEAKARAKAKPEMEHDPFIRVVAMDADGARRFCIEGFGMDPSRIEKIEDGGPSGQPEKYKPGARCWHVYTKGAK